MAFTRRRVAELQRDGVLAIYRVNEDKPHRCPVCHIIPDVIWEGRRYRRWRFYTCREGHRFSGLFGWKQGPMSGW